MIATSELRRYVGLESTDTSFDTILSNMEKGAVAFIERRTRRYFGEPQEVTEIVLGNASRNLYLRDVPLDETVYIEERSSAGADAVIVDIGDIAVRGSKLVHKTSTWVRDYEYHITYERGYEEGSAPADIMQAVTDLVALKFKGRGGLRSESIGGYSYTLAEVADVPGLLSSIDAYKAPRI